MKWIVVLLILFGLASPAVAESCTESREYLLEGLAGDLPVSAASYQSLYKVCITASTLANVKDAYLLRDGGIAIVPKNNSITATAETLAEFCERFPKSRARFINPREQRGRLTVGLVVMLSSTSSASCKAIHGLTSRMCSGIYATNSRC
jgi:hypothetical protein